MNDTCVCTHRKSAHNMYDDDCMFCGCIKFSTDNPAVANYIRIRSEYKTVYVVEAVVDGALINTIGPFDTRQEARQAGVGAYPQLVVRMGK